jgi:antitoxin ParD1/3/4
VASGKYASECDVIRESLLVLEESEMTVEQWLRSEVSDIYDEMKTKPGRGLTVEQVKASLAEDRRRRAG